GIMFTDYSGISIIVSFVFLVLYKGFKRLKFLFIFTLFSLGNIATQTRNSAITVIISLFLIGIFLMLKAHDFKLSRKKVVLSWIGVLIIIALSFLSIQQINPEIIKRTGELEGDKVQFINEAGYPTGSIASRFLIWHTAAQAFVAHPFIGIGIYSFPFSSQDYSKIPKVLYDQFVKGRTPHVGYFALLVETGVIGLLGFLFFIISSLKYSFRILPYLKDKDEKTLGIGLISIIIYISISMFVTDAWLWGHGIILFAFALGLLVALGRRVTDIDNTRLISSIKDQ
ncbi:MAG: O-antigen ligase family protein, partial [Bacteroidota bacterium]|nr:O-antigen ligase family protein [Bacteroidota bacterium]